MRKLVRVLKWALLGCCVLLVIFILFPRQVIELAHRVGDFLTRPVPLMFSGDSKDLKDTVVLPTLDTPVIPGKNIVWCSTMQMAWNKLKGDLVKEPVRISKAQEVADRFNNSPYVAQDAPEGSWYAVAGFGIAEEVRREMAARFPSMELPPLPDAELIAFAALKVDTVFPCRYFDLKKPLQFTSANGATSKLRAFGVRATDYAPRVRYQVKVWYNSGTYRTETPDEFVLELSGQDKVQVVIAHLPLLGSLSDTVTEVAAMVSEFNPRREEIVTRRLTETISESVTDPAERQKELEALAHYVGPMELLEDDTLAVPATNWRLSHRFTELEGADLLNTAFDDYTIILALQTVDFRLDRTGAYVRSIAAIAAEQSAAPRSPVPQHYAVDGPFMIMMKQRDCDRPFFVMWVDNAELLCPF
jgi:hypothetical protein